MHKIKDKIANIYKKAGYKQIHSPSESVLHFENKFSIHFVFLFESLESLKEGWRAAHDFVIEEYHKFEGPRNMEWNFYSVFLVSGVSIENAELHEIRATIQSNTSYSRKFLLADSEVDNLPPGMISPEELKSREITTQNPLEVWEKEIGQETFQLIIKGPKRLIEKKLRSFIERDADAK